MLLDRFIEKTRRTSNSREVDIFLRSQRSLLRSLSHNYFYALWRIQNEKKKRNDNRIDLIREQGR